MKMIVLGGGPGGYGCAFEAARLGASVTLIEQEHLGGTCLNRGCVPTKAILRSARLLYDASRGEEFGVSLGMAEPNVDVIRKRKDTIVGELRGQLEGMARRLKVEVVSGTGRLVAPHAVEVGGQRYEADAVVLATGSEVFKLPHIDHSQPGVWTSDDGVALHEIPAEVLLIGGGVIGLEFACAYASLGSKVTVVELTPTVLPGNDKRVTREVQKALEDLGVVFRLGDAVDGVERAGTRMRSTLRSGEVIESDIVFSAVGRAPRSEGFGFPEAGIEMDRRAVKVDEHFRTNVPGVYAIGDLIGGMMLAHVAEEEGVAAARNAVAEARGETPGASVDYASIPACVYTFPEVAVVGSSRDSAKERGLDVVQAVAKFAGNGKALAEGEAEGFVQIVAEKGSGRIVGCQIVGPHAVEIVHEVAVAMRNALPVSDLARSTHAHPTVSEVVRIAAEMADEQTRG
ncbi:MAG TPA: dihydrolipoyl dehydrogenase [Coriobacteriia bacterium]|jgi:dihydrolipoamide dehydrogenase